MSLKPVGISVKKNCKIWHMLSFEIKKNIFSIKLIFSNTQHLRRFELLSKKNSYGGPPMNFVSKYVMKKSNEQQ